MKEKWWYDGKSSQTTNRGQMVGQKVTFFFPPSFKNVEMCYKDKIRMPLDYIHPCVNA